MKNLTLATFLLGSFMSITSLVGQGYQIGDQVADFTLTGVQDNPITFSEYMGEAGAIVIFTCNTCPWAVGYEDRIQELHTDLAAKGWPILAINPNDPEQKPGDSFAAMKTRATENGIDYPYVFDEAQDIYPAFGATKTPHVFVVDKEMKVRYIGGIDDSPQNADDVKINYVKAAVDAIGKGENPDPAMTKAIGCGIKAKRS